MLLPAALTIMALLSRVVSEITGVPHCHLKYELLPETEFLTKSCIRCYKDMPPFKFKPGMKNIDLVIRIAKVSYIFE